MSKNKYYTIHQTSKLLEFINENLTPNLKDKKEHGEVFTPISLVKEMLDKLPKNVWNNPDLKWLDPAVGIGNFPIIVFLELMKGLENWEPDEEKRRKHILENMLYMVDISKKNIYILKKIFRDSEYKLNIFEGSFIDDVQYKVYNPEIKFDIIIGNPPYNKHGVGKGGGVFWTKFVFKSIEILNNNGYLCFVHPLGWRKPFKISDRQNNAGKIFYEFKEQGYIEYANISDISPQNFPKIDYYVWNKTNDKSLNKKTLIDNLFNKKKSISKINITDLKFIPNLINENIFKIFNKLFNNKKDKNYFNIIRDQNFKPNASNKKSNGTPHAFYFNVNTGEYDKVYREMGSIPDYYDKPKIMMTYNRSKVPANLYAVFYETLIGCTDNTMYQLCSKKEGKLFAIFMNSKLINFLLKITQYSESPNHKNELKILNLIKKPERLIDNPTDQDIYNYYGITKKEQELIEKSIKK